MDQQIRSKLVSHLEAYKERRVSRCQIDGDSPAVRPAIVSYGTAGFRGNASQIEHLFFNVGLIAGLRSLCVRATVGVMITASHNPVIDNGVKLIDSKGEMLESEWEQIVEKFCNERDAGVLMAQLDQLIARYNIKIDKDAICSRVIIGMDNRPSSEALVTLVKQGLDAWTPCIGYHDYGLVTTPALHFLVAESNKQSIAELPLKTYYEKLSDGYIKIAEQHPSKVLQNYRTQDLVIDCANGVGSETMHNLMKNDSKFTSFMNLALINIGDGILNKSCGADFVKSQLLPPIGAVDPDKRHAALDGDADRVVYFYLIKVQDELKIRLLDGDKIMALYALYLKDLLQKSNLEDTLSMGCVQTAYANGASTDYLTKNLSLKVDCVDTGVKNLHKRAINYDVGIYFEANGHGTIWFSDKAIDCFTSIRESHPDLSNILTILNNYTGDAISDILVVETILSYYDWDVQRWYELYQDRPNVLTKLEIPDRSIVQTSNAGRICVAPEGLQSAIDTIVSQFGPGSRAFVRASGTENVVRIYSEADTQESAEKLASLVAEKVTELCG